ncbi:hypothetical protein Poli38472_014790 [Pythium oligandrum]|uniref:Uncharacterized protein n=1 Tax=Pythium oligandrum TaxID=41045 RepID=A0A8K1CIJ8_PYTOL|nr:hypothetical protein Poli38472_014790 [Pythium oligandrum]|eukprot:TMW63880.1 hypothetical protein Poli38472_014790 [Pythium oligandrum]
MATLPDGWELRVSRSKGKVFYYNVHTKQTQWTRPETTTQDQVEELSNEELRPRDDHALSKKRKRSGHTAEVETETRQHESERHGAIARCMRVGGSTSDVVFAPWPHQVDAVEKLITAIEADTTTGHVGRYLLQHSTGSGKTMTIAALTHQLLYLIDKAGHRFHTVVLLVDRIKLDEQVGDSVELFLRRNGVDAIFRAASVDHLAALLQPPEKEEVSSNPQRVIITTVQKIGLLAKNPVQLTRLLHGQNQVDGASDKQFTRIAIITDEAHRSHSASTRQTIETVMAAGEDGTSRATFVGFTATPNGEALKLFGTRTADDYHRPFHSYAMAQSVADGRALDVLQRYKCVRCEVETNVPEAVMSDLREERLIRAVLDHASDDVAVLKAKSLYMMEDFEALKKTWTRAKCMIVTRSRRDVVRYHKLVSTYVKNKQRPWKIYASFSGSITPDGGEEQPVTEQTLNGNLTLSISDVVIVCDKLDTGYSDPLLTAMYIDRYLRSSTQAVQLLSRLNRRHKDKRSTRVVDFANHAAQIRHHFSDFWLEAQIAHDDMDKLTLMAEFRTGALILCDALTPWIKRPTKHLEDYLDSVALHQDRDAFQQLLDGARTTLTAWDQLYADEESILSPLRFPLNFEMVQTVKSWVESHSNSEANRTASQNEHLDSVISKMISRVARYEEIFSGTLHPQSLKESYEKDSHCGGLLEKFECLLRSLDQGSFEASTSISAPTTNRLQHHVDHLQAILGKSS